MARPAASPSVDEIFGTAPSGPSEDEIFGGAPAAPATPARRPFLFPAHQPNYPQSHMEAPLQPVTSPIEMVALGVGTGPAMALRGLGASAAAPWFARAAAGGGLAGGEFTALENLSQRRNPLQGVPESIIGGAALGVGFAGAGRGLRSLLPAGRPPLVAAGLSRPEPITPERIESAAVRIGGKIFTGRNHGEAILAADDAGAITPEMAKYGVSDTHNFPDNKMGLFVTNRGRVLDRLQAEREFGSTRADQFIPEAPQRLAVVPPPGPPLEPTMTRPAVSATGGKIEQVFHPEKIGLETLPAEHQSVLKTLASLGMDTRNIRSFEDMTRAAQSLGMRPEEFLKGAASRPISDAEVVATANLINEQAQVSIDAAKRLVDPSLTFDEKAMLQTSVNRAQKLIEDALKRRIRGGTESGRAIAAFRIIGNKTLDPAYWYTVAQRQLGEKPFTPEIKSAIDAAIAAGDRLALARIVAGLNRGDWADKVTTLVKAGLLSNPGTDVRNVTSTAGFSTILENVASLPASWIDRMVSIATGVRSKLAPSRLQAVETLRGFKAGAAQAKEILQHGDTAEHILERYDFNQNVAFDNPALQTFTQAVFRRLGAEDALFRQPAKFRAIAEMAEITAKNEGLRGDAFLERTRDLIKTPTPQMMEVADAEQAYRTFNQASPTASGLQRMIRRNVFTKMMGAAVVPFPRIPLNVASAVVDYSPFGMPKQVIKTLSTQAHLAPLLRQRYFVEGLGRSLTGTSILGIGWYLRSKGLATGARPKGDELNFRRGLQIPDYAIKNGGQWTQINNNAPFSNILLAGVDAYDQFHQDKPFSRKIEGSGLKMAQGLTEQTFLKGVSTALSAIQGDEVGQGLTENLAGMLVPSVLGAIARGTDPYQRRIEGPLAAIKAKVPGLREQLPAQRTVTGEQRAQETGTLGQMLSPVRSQSELKGRAADVMRALHWSPALTKPELRINGVTQKLTGDQADLFQRELGAATDRALARFDPARIRSADQRGRDRFQNMAESNVRTAKDEVRGRWVVLLRRKRPAGPSVDEVFGSGE